MITIINFVLLVLFGILSLRIFSSSFAAKRYFVLPDRPAYSYLMSKNMYFIIFIICTAPFFLGQFSLIKYGIYMGMLLYLWMQKKLVPKIDLIVGSYLLFYTWVIIGCFFTEINYNTFSLLIKYLLPILSLWLGYSAIENKYDLYHFLKITSKTCAVYALIIGGFSEIFIPWLYSFGMNSGIFLTYAGLTDYFISLFIVPLVFYWITKKRIYVLLALWILLSPILQRVRTGLGGILLVTVTYAFFRYKMKSIPLIIISGLAFLAVILFVPEINQKFFGSKAGKVNATDIVQHNALSLDNMQTSGRSAMWDLTLRKFYEPNPIFGAGTGTVTDFMKERAIKENTIALLHSDYVQILCDNGIVGLILFILFFVSVFYKTFLYTWIFGRSNIWVMITGIMAIASLSGVAFSMEFDNVVSHSMTSLINPFIFIGFFLKFIDLDKYGQLS